MSKEERLSMPMTSAGILGISAGENLAGIQIDPKTVVIATLVFVALVKIASLLITG